MSIKYLPCNAAWVVMFGTSMIDIDGCYLWNDKASLVAALRSKGLVVDTRSNVIR